MQKLKTRHPSRPPEQVEQLGLVDLRTFQRVNSAMAAITNQVCSLKPELSLLIELYGAEREGRVLSVSSVGLVSGIAPTTAIRYIRFLEQRGWIICSQHESDKRVTRVRLAPSLVDAFDEVFGGSDV